MHDLEELRRSAEATLRRARGRSAPRSRPHRVRAADDPAGAAARACGESAAEVLAEQRDICARLIDRINGTAEQRRSAEEKNDAFARRRLELEQAIDLAELSIELWNRRRREAERTLQRRRPELDAARARRREALRATLETRHALERLSSRLRAHPTTGERPE